MGDKRYKEHGTISRLPGLDGMVNAAGIARMRVVGAAGLARMVGAAGIARMVGVAGGTEWFNYSSFPVWKILLLEMNSEACNCLTCCCKLATVSL